MPARQRTRLASVEQAFGQQLDPLLRGPWWRRAWTVVAALLGFLVASLLMEAVESVGTVGTTHRHYIVDTSLDAIVGARAVGCSSSMTAAVTQ